MDGWFILYRRGTTIESPLEIFRSYNSSHTGHYRWVVAATKQEEGSALWKNKESIVSVRAECTFSVELESMERMLIQIELTVMAGDQESYRISANDTQHQILLWSGRCLKFAIEQ